MVLPNPAHGLQGARDDAHAVRIERNLRRRLVMRLFDERLAVRSAGNHRLLRSRGITVRTTVDMPIGTFRIENGYHLSHGNRGFDPMARHLGLKALHTPSPCPTAPPAPSCAPQRGRHAPGKMSRGTAMTKPSHPARKAPRP